MKSAVQERTAMNIRLPVPLRVWLKERADRNRRSQTGELTILIEEWKAAEEAKTKNPAHP